MRAISLRTARSLPWLSSCPVAPWKRRLNSSSLASASLDCSSSSVETRSCATRPLAISLHRPLALSLRPCQPAEHREPCLTSAFTDLSLYNPALHRELVDRP